MPWCSGVLHDGKEGDMHKRSVLVKGGTIISPEGRRRADILIEGEHIAAIGVDFGEGHQDEIVDATNRAVLPGLVDVHTHLECPVDDLVTADDFRTGTVAAAVGGTTTIIDFALNFPPQRVQDSLTEWLRKIQTHPPVIDVGLHMIVTEVHGDDAEADLKDLCALGVTSFKLFMAYKGSFMVDDETLFRTARAAAEAHGVVMVHAENGEVVDLLTREALQRGQRAPVWHARTRPPETEAEAVSRAIHLCDFAKAPLYVVHVSCRQAGEEVERARADGLRVWGETCPQYLVCDDTMLLGEESQAARFVFTPPPRTPADQMWLWDALRRNVLSVVSTDHSPFALREKLAATSFADIPQGTGGIEYRLGLLLAGVHAGRLSLERLVDVCARTPARLFGMYPRKGEIAVGSDGDVVVLDPDREATVAPGGGRSMVDHGIYDGMTVAGCVETVIARGRTIVREGQFMPDSGAGGFVSRAGWMRDTGRLSL
jgi:dihydropyrimidinase